MLLSLDFQIIKMILSQMMLFLIFDGDDDGAHLVTSRHQVSTFNSTYGPTSHKYHEVGR